MGMIQSVKELPDVDFQNPAPVHVHGLPPQRLQRLMRRSFGPEAIRAVVKVLLVDRLQQHDDRPLQHLVCKRRDADGSGLVTRALRYVHPPHRRRPVRAGLRRLQQSLQVAPESLVEVVDGLSIHAHGPVRPRSLIGDRQPVHVHVVGQGSQTHLRVLLRQLRYPLLFRTHGYQVRSPGHVSLQRFLNQAPPSLPRVLVRRVPPARRYYGTLRLPPPVPPRLVTRGGYHPLRLRSLPRTRRRSGAWSFRVWQPHANLRTEADGHSQVPRESFCAYALLSDPGRTATSGHTTQRRGPRGVENEGSYGAGISRLNHTASAHAVYASPIGSHRRTQDSLPLSANSTERDLNPQDSTERFPRCFLTSPPPFLGLLDATTHPPPPDIEKRLPSRLR